MDGVAPGRGTPEADHSDLQLSARKGAFVAGILVQKLDFSGTGHQGVSHSIEFALLPERDCKCNRCLSVQRE